MCVHLCKGMRNEKWMNMGWKRRGEKKYHCVQCRILRCGIHHNRVLLNKLIVAHVTDELSPFIEPEFSIMSQSFYLILNQINEVP